MSYTDSYPSYNQDRGPVDLLKLETQINCKTILDTLLAAWWHRAKDIKSKIDEALSDPGDRQLVSSNILISKDSHTDDIASYRMRLIPMELKRGIEFESYEVTEIAIRIPEPFVNDQNELADVSLALIRFGLKSNGGVDYINLAVTHAGIVQYDKFNTLDFIIKNERIKEITVMDIVEPKLAKDRERPLLDNAIEEATTTNDPLTSEWQLEYSKLLLRAMNEYVLGRQSRKDGTM